MTNSDLIENLLPKIQPHFSKRDFVFLAISGAHLYGFESFNSDIDLRGVHVPDRQEILRYFNTSDTFEWTTVDPSIWPEEVDVVSHSLLKFFHLLSKQPNGYLLEQVFSPLILKTSKIHEEIKEIATLTISKELYHHYNGFFHNQQKLLSNQKKELKLTLYQLRIICTSVFVARHGRINANLLECNRELNLLDHQKLERLVNLKRNGEKNNFPGQEIKDYWLDQIEQKKSLIESELKNSNLPNFDQKKVVEAIEQYLGKLLTLTYGHR